MRQQSLQEQMTKPLTLNPKPQNLNPCTHTHWNALPVTEEAIEPPRAND